jgi:hypothetical protein
MPRLRILGLCLTAPKCKPPEDRPLYRLTQPVHSPSTSRKYVLGHLHVDTVKYYETHRRSFISLQLTEWAEIERLAQLPALEDLLLVGNPLAEKYNVSAADNPSKSGSTWRLAVRMFSNPFSSFSLLCCLFSFLLRDRYRAHEVFWRTLSFPLVTRKMNNITIGVPRIQEASKAC